MILWGEFVMKGLVTKNLMLSLQTMVKGRPQVLANHLTIAVGSNSCI